MNKLIKIVLLQTILQISFATKWGVDISKPLTEASAKCLKENGKTYAIIRGYRSFGDIDHSAKDSIANSKKAGLYTDMYHFPCLGKVTPQEQANESVKYLGNSVDRYWIDIEYNPSHNCQWSTSNYKLNCQFLQELVQAFESHHVKIGIYANSYQWKNIFGSLDACPHFSQYPLWYPRYNTIYSFEDFTPFAGWKTPLIKQYSGSGLMCELGVDLNLSYNYPPNSEDKFLQ